MEDYGNWITLLESDPLTALSIHKSIGIDWHEAYRLFLEQFIDIELGYYVLSDNWWNEYEDKGFAKIIDSNIMISQTNFSSLKMKFNLPHISGILISELILDVELCLDEISEEIISILVKLSRDIYFGVFGNHPETLTA